ncbi:MAG: MraY family glycosyltransferase [Sedimentisphaerales bacterium]|jgi:UDP-GlcNAc:undecaprenyl-phosphate GlcNAc-1-phosphate transferase
MPGCVARRLILGNTNLLTIGLDKKGMWDVFLGSKRSLDWCVQFWPVLVSSFVCALIATWLCKAIALRFNIVDKPDNLVKTHKKPVAYLGGIGVLAGFIVGALCGIYLIRGQTVLSDVMRWLFGIIAGATMACFVGLIDDLLDISPTKKMLGQVVAASTLIFAGIRPDLSEIVKSLGWQTMSDTTEIAIGIPIIIFFVLGATNSLNLLDGLDGLCGGVTVIITVGMLILAVRRSTYIFSSERGDVARVIICLALVGGVCGFLPFNRHPAKIFMGDAGSMMLGFVSAAIMMLLARIVPRWWIASIVVFGLPILDTGTALLRRFINKRPLFVSDRGHIYDQMIDRGISLNRTVGICYALAGLYASLGVLTSMIQTRYAFIACALIFLVSFLVVWRMGFLKMEGLRGAIHQKDDTDKTRS